ncbi:hypothetical protein [Rubellimicrobium sp. CFH 75288]|uniref:hypothetical protein n=1 Tax=Rubellimicrobium sp. CFH 75288 TaxID=2697034 RepID=UPI001412139F|nr:hypothetical protein [Rubellimicrobium sp. CFH 75288]NAZ36641.1 hypothetical protein [Rubellimicrobium sp. CFH 75288]
MDLPALPAAAFALAALALPYPATDAPPAEGPDALVGAVLYATEDPVPRWGEPVRAEDLRLDQVGRISAVHVAAEGETERLVVSVGGLWGLGAQQVEVGAERLRVLPTDGGGSRLVLDLSARGAEPPPG